MITRYGSALAAVLLAAGLAACGGSSSDFKARAMAECEKNPQAMTMGGGNIDCECAVNIMDKELDDKTKKFIVTAADADKETDAAKKEQMLKDAGFTEADAMAILPKMMEAVQKVEKECKKA
jgi:hypothetical protein